MFPITCNAVGDIIALAELVLDLARAMNDIHGSPASYRALDLDLKSLHIVLASVHRAAQLTNDTLLREQIVGQVKQYEASVRRALERIAKFSALGRAGTADDSTRVKVKRQWYKIEWRLRQGSIDTIREELASVTQRLATYLAVSNA